MLTRSHLPDREEGRTAPALAAPTGRSLDRTVAAQLGTAFGQDFSRIRVHADDRADTAARALGAAAFATGGHIHFARGRYAPGTTAGRHLLAHELAHVVQQRGATGTSTVTAVSRRQRLERAADAAADRAVEGRRTGFLAATGPAVQCQDPATADAKGAEAKKDEEPLLDGLKVVGEKLADDAKVRQHLIDPVVKPLERRALGVWHATPGWAKGTAIGTGVAGVAGLGAWQLSSAEGRRRFSGVNVGKPLGWIPYSPVSAFTYTLPESLTKEGGGGISSAHGPGLRTPLKEQYRFALDVDVSDYLRLLPALRHLEDLSATGHGEWAYDPARGTVRLLGLNASVGVRGISLSGGLYRSVMPALSPMQLRGTESPLLPQKTIPGAGDGPASGPDVRIFLNVDLRKLVTGI